MARQNFSRKNDEAARAAVALIIEREISDPRIFMTTVTGVEVSPDKSVAHVFVSNDPSRYEDMIAGLESAKGRIRSLLGKAVGWRSTPDLQFHIDEALDEGQRIADILASADERREQFASEDDA
ncbi:MAG: 30S ribosome-binding factor RbfA [Coriobacteriia bacterium]|nr:30S ribosome-binding factor RbfA [Coriobacteriia bacterium]MCL2746675.1 30S ribosome-binding factor RbfA [Coriobacteriia bacterium]MCL2870138.1 30S ribosome-binding factor RbfA [Coriobacteriia bacterium]